MLLIEGIYFFCYECGCRHDLAKRGRDEVEVKEQQKQQEIDAKRQRRQQVVDLVGTHDRDVEKRRLLSEQHQQQQQQQHPHQYPQQQQQQLEQGEAVEQEVLMSHKPKLVLKSSAAKPKTRTTRGDLCFLMTPLVTGD